MMKNIAKMAVGLFLGMVILLLPIIGTISAVGSPFRVMGEIFNSVFGSEGWEEVNDVTLLIDYYLETSQSKEYFNEIYLPHILDERQIHVPLNYLFIPLLLSGIESPTEEEILFLISSAKKEVVRVEYLYDENGNIIYDEYGKPLEERYIEYELKSTDEFVQIIYTAEPYHSVFSIVEKDEISKLINRYAYISIYHRTIDSEERFVYPFTMKADITAEMGWYSPFGYIMWHDAIDLAFPAPNACGMPIYSVSDGVVVGVQHTDGKHIANTVTVDAGEGVTIKYVHMADSYVMPVGSLISRGDYIGLVGNSGRSTACHLHLNFKLNGVTVNPREFIDFDNPY